MREKESRTHVRECYKIIIMQHEVDDGIKNRFNVSEQVNWLLKAAYDKFSGVSLLFHEERI